MPQYGASALLLIALLFALPSTAERPAAADPLPAQIEIDGRDRPNTLTAQESAAGWKLLWDGITPRHWREVEGDDFPDDGWSIEKGALTIRNAGIFEFRAGGDLFSRARYGAFIFDFEFRLSKGANSGIKYLAEVQNERGFVHSLGCEFQLLDDLRHPDAGAGRGGNRTLASLYDLFPAKETKDFRGIESWNHGRIHFEAGRIAHYLNGARVLSTEIGSERWDAALAGSKFADRAAFCRGPRGHIVLQDHGDRVSFRNLRILSLD
ncbi:MAG: DUF1080 domain-containing protein [bacterium]|nr:DUF1080 domain-containing protein [bacterium]